MESRFVGMKSRGVYETPGGTVLLTAHRGIESICLDRGEMHLKVRQVKRNQNHAPRRVKGGSVGGPCGATERLITIARRLEW